MFNFNLYLFIKNYLTCLIRVLEELYLNNNKIKDHGAMQIADGIKDHPKLKILELEIC